MNLQFSTNVLCFGNGDVLQIALVLLDRELLTVLSYVTSLNTVALSPNSITLIFTETFPRGKSCTQTVTNDET